MNKIEHFYQNESFGEDWFTYQELYKAMVEKFPSGSHFVEIGCWKGKSTAFMGVEIHNSGKNIKFDAIDTFKGSDEHQQLDIIVNNKLYDLFISNINPVSHIINPIVMPSVEASKIYDDRSLDFVFIDGDHQFESVKNDIQCWLPKIKKGGVLAGHDYTCWWESVTAAVTYVFGEGNYSDPWNCGCYFINVV